MEHYVTWSELLALGSFLVLFVNMVVNLVDRKNKNNDDKDKKK